MSPYHDLCCMHDGYSYVGNICGRHSSHAWDVVMYIHVCNVARLLVSLHSSLLCGYAVVYIRRAYTNSHSNMNFLLDNLTEIGFTNIETLPHTHDKQKRCTLSYQLLVTRFRMNIVWREVDFQRKDKWFESVPDCSNSIVTQWSYCSLALSHRYELTYINLLQN